MKLYSTPVTNRKNSFAVKSGIPSRSVCVITLRIPYKVLTAIREAAHGSGLSMNEYLTRTICCNALEACRAIKDYLPNPNDHDAGCEGFLGKVFEVNQSLATFANGASHVPANPQ